MRSMGTRKGSEKMTSNGLDPRAVIQLKSSYVPKLKNVAFETKVPHLKSIPALFRTAFGPNHSIDNGCRRRMHVSLVVHENAIGDC